MTGIAVITTTAAFAADSSKSYEFNASVNGQDSIEIQKGDTVSLKVTLKQTSSNESVTMYAVNDSIRFNSSLLQLNEESIKTKDGITYSLNSLSGSWNGWTDLNIGVYSKAAEGDEWNNSEVLIEAEFTAVSAGSAVIMQRDAAMYTITGMDVYECKANSPFVTVKSGGSVSGGEQTGGNSGQGGSGTASSGNNSGSSGAGSSSADDVQQPDQNGNSNDSGNSNTPAASTFSDVSADAWYADAVNYVTSNGLFNGTNGNTFSPDSQMTRAMMVTVLYRMAGSPDVAGGVNTFSDIASGMWYTDAITWASSKSIVNGYSNGTFGVNDSVTREQLAAILYRYAVSTGAQAELTSANGAADGFADSARISIYAKTAVDWAVENGLINGKGNNKLDPRGTATRAELAAILMRFNESILK